MCSSDLLALVAIAADASTVGRLPTELQSNKVWSLSLVIGVVYLCLGLTFDRRGWRGFATPFFAVGDVAFVWGVAAAVTRIDGLGGPALVVVASLVLGFVGDAGGRRLTTWLGGAGVVVGSISLATQLVDSKNVIPNALAILFFGTGMLGAGLALSRSDTGDTGPASEPEAAPEANDGGTA